MSRGSTREWTSLITGIGGIPRFIQEKDYAIEKAPLYLLFLCENRTYMISLNHLKDKFRKIKKHTAK